MALDVASAKLNFSAVEADLLDAAAQVLLSVDDAPRDIAGVLAFGDDGFILIENRKVCWAVANEMSVSLTDILSKQANPPVSRLDLERVYRRCKQERKALGEGLVESGLVSAEDVRRALVAHHAEAIGRLAYQGGQATRFTPTKLTGYDPRFTLSTAEALASLLPERLTEYKLRAQAHLQQLPLADASAFGFVLPFANSTPLIAEAGKDCQLAARQVLEIARWATTTREISHMFDPQIQVTSALWSTHHAAVVWEYQEIAFVAICKTRPASALLMNALTQRLTMGSTSAVWPPTKVRP
jgi:hypothetical protein